MITILALLFMSYNHFVGQEIHITNNEFYVDYIYIGNTFDLNNTPEQLKDYYTRTVFEIKSNNLGSQNAVCGGGRYDNLVKQLGGEDTPAVGWAMGMERLFSLIQTQTSSKSDVFVVSNFTKAPEITWR